MPGNPALLEIIRTKGHLHVDTPLQLASGEWSQDFVDGKKALAHGPDLRLACEVLLDEVHAAGVTFDVVGGLTMGADHLSHGVALVGSVAWFTVRKEAKGHGMGGRVAGALEAGDRVAITEDAVTRGVSMLEAAEVIRAVGAEPVLLVPVVDRGGTVEAMAAEAGIPLRALVTAPDLGFPFERDVS